MIWSNYLYNNTAIEVTAANYSIMLSDDLNPRELNYSDEIENIESYHGVTASPTYARGRPIWITGYIMAETKAGFGEAMNYLDTLFKLQANTAVLETKKFKYTDDYGVDWEADVKIKIPLKYEPQEFDSHHFIRKFTVVLLAPDPKFFSPVETSQTAEEWFVGGIAITNDWVAITNDGIAINENSGTFVITPAAWNQPLEPRFVITVKEGREVNGFLRMKNATLDKYIQFDIEATAWQVFIIDSSNETATLDGVNIMASKSTGDFITIDGETEVEIYDDDGIYTGKDIDIVVYFKNILL